MKSLMNGILTLCIKRSYLKFVGEQVDAITKDVPNEECQNDVFSKRKILFAKATFFKHEIAIVAPARIDELSGLYQRFLTSSTFRSLPSDIIPECAVVTARVKNLSGFSFGIQALNLIINHLPVAEDQEARNTLFEECASECCFISCCMLCNNTGTLVCKFLPTLSN